MIPAVSRGGRMRGLLRYLVGPGHKGEHHDPHLVGGDGVELWRGVKLDGWAADQLAEQLDAPRLRARARVTVPRKAQDGSVLVDDRGRPVRADAHVWHCSLSLHPDEEALSDERWAQIAGEFVGEMGFGGQRWVALRHGLTSNGGDHVHLVVQLVGEDGSSARVHNDRPRAQEACRKLERDHGLRVVEGRAGKRGARATDYRQRYRAQSEHERGLIGSPEPDREILERTVRQFAAASASEGELVRRLRAQGLIVRPRFAAGRDDQVVGYSVALTPADGKQVVAHAGGKLAKDLTLPRLRATHGWTAQDPDAIDEWQRAFHGREPGVGPESNPWLESRLLGAGVGGAAGAARRSQQPVGGGAGSVGADRRADRGGAVRVGGACGRARAGAARSRPRAVAQRADPRRRGARGAGRSRRRGRSRCCARR